MTTLKGLLILMLSIVLVSWNDVHASTFVGQCVYPNVEVYKIVVYDTPAHRQTNDTTIKYASYLVGAREGWFIGLWTTPDYTKDNPYEHSGEFIGWVDLREFDQQALRNCY